MFWWNGCRFISSWRNKNYLLSFSDLVENRWELHVNKCIVCNSIHNCTWVTPISVGFILNNGHRDRNSTIKPAECWWWYFASSIVCSLIRTKCAGVCICSMFYDNGDDGERPNINVFYNFYILCIYICMYERKYE